MLLRAHAESKDCGGQESDLPHPLKLWKAQILNLVRAARGGFGNGGVCCGKAGDSSPGAYNRGVDSDQRDPISDDPEQSPAENRTAREVAVGRILGLDVGSSRTGVAVSDPPRTTAQGLDTLQRRNKRHDFEYLQRVIQEYDVREIVVGLPLRMSGAEGTQSDN